MTTRERLQKYIDRLAKNNWDYEWGRDGTIDGDRNGQIGIDCSHYNHELYVAQGYEKLYYNSEFMLKESFGGECFSFINARDIQPGDSVVFGKYTFGGDYSELDRIGHVVIVTSFDSEEMTGKGHHVNSADDGQGETDFCIGINCGSNLGDKYLYDGSVRIKPECQTGRDIFQKDFEAIHGPGEVDLSDTEYDTWDPRATGDILDLLSSESMDGNILPPYEPSNEDYNGLDSDQIDALPVSGDPMDPANRYDTSVTDQPVDTSTSHENFLNDLNTLANGEIPGESPSPDDPPNEWADAGNIATDGGYGSGSPDYQDGTAEPGASEDQPPTFDDIPLAEDEFAGLAPAEAAEDPAIDENWIPITDDEFSGETPGFWDGLMEGVVGPEEMADDGTQGSKPEFKAGQAMNAGGQALVDSMAAEQGWSDLQKFVGKVGMSTISTAIDYNNAWRV